MDGRMMTCLHLLRRGLQNLIAVGCLSLLSIVAAAPQQIEFQKLADGYLAEHEIPGKKPSEITLQELIDTHFLAANLGAVDLRFPRSFFGDKGVTDDFKDVATAILQTHAAWLDLLAAKGEAPDATRADIAEALKWLKSARVAPGAEKASDFISAFNGGAAILPTFQRISESFRSGAALGFTPRGPKPQVLVVAPTRHNFLELAGVFGLVESSGRSLYWNDSLIGWTEFGWNELQVIALMYPPAKTSFDNLTEGMSMDEREPTGLMQHVAQRCAVQLAWHSFDKLLDSAFELAIAQSLVVDLYKGNNTRSGGASRGNTTDGITAFVPGGNSAGGALPPTNAESSWRTTGGTDYFVKPLRASQKSGGKSAKSKEEKVAYFQLLSEDTSKRLAMRAPFFGSAAQGKELPPPEFMIDYQEFFRAYKTAFVHWMRDMSRKSEKESRELFAKLLGKIAEVGSAATFEELVKEVYGVPFSAGDMGTDSLEHSFLVWLGGNAG